MTIPAKRGRKPSMRSVLLDALRSGETNVARLVAIGKQFDPTWSETRIKTSLAVHRGFLKKKSVGKPGPAGGLPSQVGAL